MELLVVSFLAGALTVLAPCILPVLPLIVGGSSATKKSASPFIITASLAISVFIFTILLRASTSLLGIPQEVWQFVSGGIIIILGILFLFPRFWESAAAKFNASSNKMLSKAGRKQGVWRDIATGAALGPVFSSCSPTYAFIVAIVLPRSIGEGLLNLTAYTIGLAALLLLVALLGQKIIQKLNWASDPNGWFRKVLAILFIFVGIAIIFGWDKDLQAYIIDQGWYAPVENIELNLR